MNQGSKSFLQSVRDVFGSVEILVNCAGKTKRTPSLEVSDQDWDSIMETNLNVRGELAGYSAAHGRTTLWTDH